MSIFGYISLPIVLLLLVFIAIAIRRIGQFRLPIWLIMVAAAIIVLLSGHITVKQAYHAISFDVVFYLLGVFVIGQALEASHYLEYISFKFFNRLRNLSMLLLAIIIVFALSSALLMNDTIAIIGTPVILLLARQHQFNAKPFLLALAYAITLGSVMSPVGNPQNLLIANQGLNNPFVTFFIHLAIPTIINLALLYGMIWFYYRRQLNINLAPIKSEKVIDLKLARISQFSVGLLIILIVIKVILANVASQYEINFASIALVACSPILLFSKRRASVLRHLDWHTLLFFIGLFVFMKSVWLSQFFQELLQQSHINVTHKSSIFAISVVISQFVSNVPLVALYLPLLKQAQVGQLLALAAGSTIAGNLLILGAASNVIIIQNAEKRGDQAFSFWEFFKLGLPLTLLNVIIYYSFL